MKAIILERRGEYAAVLCEDGTFLSRRVSGEVGETVELDAEIVSFPRKRNTWVRNAVAAALALSLTGGTLGYMGGTASAYVSLDVDEDSSIELAVNHFGRVIAVNALDDGAKDLARSLYGEVRHRRAEDAFDIMVDRLHGRGYFGEPGGTIIAGVATNDGRRASELRELVERSVERGGDHVAYVAETSRDERRQAMEQHVSAGRFGFERDHRGQLPPGMGPGEAPPPPMPEPPPAPGQSPRVGEVPLSGAADSLPQSSPPETGSDAREAAL